VHLPVRDGGKCTETLRETTAQSVTVNIAKAMKQAAGLSAHGSDDTRMAMADRGDAESGSQV